MVNHKYHISLIRCHTYQLFHHRICAVTIQWQQHVECSIY